MPAYRKNIPKETKPIGVCPTCNFGGVCIMEIQNGIDDYVISAEHYGDEYLRVSRSRIMYNAKGHPYFTRNKQKYYLNEFLKVG